MSETEGQIFRLPERTKTFTFDDGEWAGAEIVCRLSPVRLADVIEMGSEQTVGELISSWAKIALVSWNLALPDGNPIPCDVDGLGYLPLATQMALVDAWLEEVNRIPAPLPRRSSAGASSEPELEPTSQPS